MTTFNLPAPDLAAAVDWAARVVPARPHTPVLAGVVVDADGDAVSLSAFDFDQAATVTADAVVTTPGRVLVSGRLLQAVAKAAGKGHLEFAADGASVTVTVGRSSWRLPTLPLEDYPTLPELGDPVGRIDGTVFAEAAARVVPAAGRDDTLPMLTGIKLEAGDSGLEWAATDRFRLATCSTVWQPAVDDAPLDVLAPAALVKNIAAAARGHEVTVHASEGMLGATVGRHAITGRLLDAQFPRWRQLLTHDPDRYVDVDAALLSAAVEQASALGGTQLRLAIGVEVIEVAESGTQNDGQATRAEAPVVGLHADPVAVGVNPAYLRDVLAACGIGPVRMFLGSSANRPVLFQPLDGDTGFMGLVMPVRLQGEAAAA